MSARSLRPDLHRQVCHELDEALIASGIVADGHVVGGFVAAAADRVLAVFEATTDWALIERNEHQGGGR